MESSDTQHAVSSWDEFYAAYDAAHRDPMNRAIHHTTHVALMAALPLVWRGHPLTFAALALISLPINWLVHEVFEHNQPAFLRAADPWGKLQIAVGGLGWTAVTLWRSMRGG
jgi:hypothetical protein